MEPVVEIREALKEDCLEIRNLIQELADFEEMPDGPKIDHRVLEDDGFCSRNPLFKCYVACCNNQVVGYALYFYIYYTLDKKAIHLEDIFVTPEFRKKYVGSRLFQTVAEKIFEEDCQFLDFSVLSWNSAQDFYKSKGSIDLTEMEGWHMYRINYQPLKTLASNSCPSNDIYKIREATLDDYDRIKRLAEEATRSEKMLNEHSHNEMYKIQIDVSDNEEFGKQNAHFGYFVATLNDQVVGYALYCYAYSTWEGKSMYLQEFQVPDDADYAEHIKKDLLSAISKLFRPFPCRYWKIFLENSENWKRQALLNIAKCLRILGEKLIQKLPISRNLLLDPACVKASDENCCRIDFWIQDPKKTGQFFLKNGAVDLTVNEEWHLYRLFELTKKPA